MRVLIADDEELIRFTLRDMIKEASLTVTDIYEAANGRDLIQQFRSHPVDLVLADIRMPGLSGLDAMEELKEEKAHWVILTGHADFEYARKALQLGADDYLLKPPSAQELEKVLHRIQSLIVKEKSEEQRLLEHSLNHIISGSSAYDYESKLQGKGFWSGLLIYLDNSHKEQESLEIRNRVSRNLRDFFNTTECGGLISAIVTLETGCLFLCLFSTSPINFDAKISTLMQTLLSEEQNYHIIGIPEEDEFNRFAENWKSVESQGWQRFVSPPGSFLKIREDLPPELEGFCQKLEEWIVLKPDKREAEDLQILLEESKQAESYEEIKMNLKSMFPKARGDSIVAILKNIGHQSRTDSNSSRSVLVDQAKRIIAEHFHEEIGIAQIAYNLEVTPNYLSSLFRKHTGIAFTKYITNIRIEKAKELMKDSNLNVKEITSEVGYRSSRHFSAIFRQEEGVSPTEYIKSCRT
ncbi:response regulator [Oceanispirochaeta crateris]|uniref:Response regulator n=1 Tax=Oceanispirochaeta crateris TaxID=2518645 RepID=A0A5C1QQL9_9SPIO|nr:response regulator [Oceanispirochaeta crateris]QEN09509.1 response regulator [Oceanispirochaeta crateris]